MSRKTTPSTSTPGPCPELEQLQPLSPTSRPRTPTSTTCFGKGYFEGSCLFPPCIHGGTNVGGGEGEPTTNPDEQCKEQTAALSCDVVCRTAPTSTCTTDCASTRGCSITATTTTTSISENAYFIPTPVADYLRNDNSDQFIMSILASTTSSDDAIEAQTSTSLALLTSKGKSLCLASRHVNRVPEGNVPVWSMHVSGTPPLPFLRSRTPERIQPS